jgi:pimeloyl-ACP methyl ester carboxylesterase
MATLGIVVFASAAVAQPSLPSTFKAQTVTSPDGATIFVRSGGSGPVVVLLHGYAETSDSWGPLAAELVKSYTVVVPDLRGWDAPRARREVTTRKRKPRTSEPWSRRSGTTGHR